MATHKPFREIVKPGTNFEFVGRARTWALISTLLILASIGALFVNKEVRGSYLNWTIDFKGGTELIFGFKDAETGERIDDIGAGDVRKVLEDAGEDGFEVSNFEWEEEIDGEDHTSHGILLRTPTFGAVDEKTQEKIADAFEAEFGEDREILKADWSGDRFFVRAKAPFTWEEGHAFFAKFGLEVKKWGDVRSEQFATAEEGTGEYNIEYAIWGIDRQYHDMLEEGLGVDVEIIQTYGVGAKAGEKLRNDGIKALFYSLILILLYLAVRFDIRYAPGAVAALFHDAILVTGVFAVTYTDVSLTSVAALLTVIGYSVNDTVVIFDRIRENVGRLKDKKLARVINISLNETLSRTLLTSVTLFVVALMMNIFGTGMVQNFAFALNVGVVVGVYSSVFVASPILLYIDTKYYGGARRVTRGAGKSARISKASAKDKSASKASEDAPSESDDDPSDEPDGAAATSTSPKKKRPSKKRRKAKK